MAVIVVLCEELTADGGLDLANHVLDVCQQICSAVPAHGRDFGLVKTKRVAQFRRRGPNRNMDVSGREPMDR